MATSTNAAVSWSFRLRGPGGATAALEIAPDAHVQRFSELAAQLLHLPASKPLTFRAGFPPRVVSCAPDDCVQRVFARSDTVVVGVADAAGSAPTIIQGSGAPPGRRGRAGTSATSKAAAAAAKPTAKKAQGGVHTLSGPAARGKRVAARGHGMRLGDAADDDDAAGGAGAEAAAESDEESAPPQRKYRRAQALQLTSKDDVALSLANAVSGHGTDRAAKFFRATTKSAVEHQYELALANARLNAALAGRFEIQEDAGARAGGEQATQMLVRFKEGVRKWREERVAMLHGAELQAVLKYVLLSGGETGKEMLKPFNMAQCSPRVFWSIARLYSGDVARGLAELAPEEDWSYLDTRTRAMSQKAIEAKANEEHWKQWKRTNSATNAQSRAAEQQPAVSAGVGGGSDVIVINEDEDEVANASQSAEPNAASASSQTRPTATPVPSASVANRTGRGADKMSIQRALRAATARAALSRFDVAAQTAEVVSAFQQEEAKAQVAATRDDEDTDTDDESVEPTTTVYCDACDKARILSADEAALADVSAAHWTCANLRQARPSTSCDDVDDEVEQIAGAKIAALLQKARVHTRKDLANATASKTLKLLVTPQEGNANATLKERLASMIDEARLDEVNDLMVEIVGDADLVGLLELEKLGTPADLVTTPLDLVYDAVRGDEHAAVSVARVQTWRERAAALVLQFPWLNDWRTI